MTNPTELVGKRADASLPLPPANFWTTAGQSLQNVGNTFLQYASIMSNNGGYSGYGGLSGLFNSGDMITSYDQFQQNLALNFGACGGYGNGGTGLGNGINTPTNQGDLKWVNNNEAFDKLDSETLSKLKDIEAKIKEQEEIIADENKSEAEREAAGNKLDTLKKQYKNLESKMKLNGQTPSQFLKKNDYSLYTNLDIKELDQIKKMNEEIAALKKEAEELQKEYNNREQAAMAKINQASMMGVMAQSVISKDDQEALKNLKSQYEEKCKEISDKIKELEDCVATAVKDDSVTNFTIARHKSGVEKREKERKAADAKVGSTIAEKLFDKDGKIVENTAALKAEVKRLNSNYNDGYIDEIIDEIKTLAKDGKESFVAELSKTDSQLHTKLLGIIGTDGTEGRNEKASILISVLDGILGAKGRYEQIVDNAAVGTAGCNGKNIVKAANAYQPEKARGDKRTETPGKPNEKKDKKIADAKKAIGEGHYGKDVDIRQTAKGKTVEEAFLVAVDKYRDTNNLPFDAKNPQKSDIGVWNFMNFIKDDNTLYQQEKIAIMDFIIAQLERSDYKDTSSYTHLCGDGKLLAQARSARTDMINKFAEAAMADINRCKPEEISAKLFNYHPDIVFAIVCDDNKLAQIHSDDPERAFHICRGLNQIVAEYMGETERKKYTYYFDTDGCWSGDDFYLGTNSSDETALNYTSWADFSDGTALDDLEEKMNSSGNGNISGDARYIRNGLERYKEQIRNANINHASCLFKW